MHEHSTGSERVDALGRRRRAVEVIICMITRDFSVISNDVTGVSLSLSPSHKSHSRTRRKRFRASYNTKSWEQWRRSPIQRSRVTICRTMPLSVKEHKQRALELVSFSMRLQQLNCKISERHLACWPSLLPNLTRLLIRFREFYAAFQADIKKAFFYDRHSTRRSKVSAIRVARFQWRGEDVEAAQTPVRNELLTVRRQFCSTTCHASAKMRHQR